MLRVTACRQVLRVGSGTVVLRVSTIPQRPPGAFSGVQYSAATPDSRSHDTDEVPLCIH